MVFRERRPSRHRATPERPGGPGSESSGAPDEELDSYLAALDPRASAPDAALSGRFGNAQVFQVRLPGRQTEQLRLLADARGVPPTSLVVDWVLERLEREATGPGPGGPGPGGPGSGGPGVGGPGAGGLPAGGGPRGGAPRAPLAPRLDPRERGRRGLGRHGGPAGGFGPEDGSGLGFASDGGPAAGLAADGGPGAGLGADAGPGGRFGSDARVDTEPLFDRPMADRVGEPGAPASSAPGGAARLDPGVGAHLGIDAGTGATMRFDPVGLGVAAHVDPTGPLGVVSAPAPTGPVPDGSLSLLGPFDEIPTAALAPGGGGDGPSRGAFGDGPAIGDAAPMAFGEHGGPGGRASVDDPGPLTAEIEPVPRDADPLAPAFSAADPLDPPPADDPLDPASPRPPVPPGSTRPASETSEDERPPAPVTPIFRAGTELPDPDQHTGPRHRAPEPVVSLLTRRKF